MHRYAKIDSFNLGFNTFDLKLKDKLDFLNVSSPTLLVDEMKFLDKKIKR
jgi:hypothetical protein